VKEQKEQREMKVKMVRGLMAFEEIVDYELKAVPGNPYFFWLEADGGPSFLLTQPGFFFNDYQLTIDRSVLACLQPGRTVPEVYVLVTVPEKTLDMTANLLGPLFVNKENGLALQVVLENTSYTTRHYLFPPERRRDCG
jgi:flagellar assembly factor FliW